MAEDYKIERVAVLGAGVMGATLAAHMANAGIPVDLLDIVPFKLTDADEAKGLTKESPEWRNSLAQKGLQSALKAKPAAFMNKADAKLVRIGNLDDHFDRLKDADWIFEVVIERLDIKQQLFERIEGVRKPAAIVTSNTSGIPIAAMAEGRSLGFCQHFMITHFFNPPRYLKLFELIPSQDCLPEVVDFMAGVAEELLGKGVVYAKDTPAFVGNRLGVQGMIKAIQHVKDLGLTVEATDKILGRAVGRPGTGLFRLGDLVGVDTLGHVVHDLYERCPDDEEHDSFVLDPVIQHLIDNGNLGGKTGAGFYKKDRDEEGKRIILSLDLDTLAYTPQEKVSYASVEKAKKIDDVGERIRHMCSADDDAGKLAWRSIRDSLIYAANRVPEIADDVVNIDNGMKWGFAHTMGPFETWDALGVKETAARIAAEGLEVPATVTTLLESGADSFYRFGEDGYREFFDVAGDKVYKPEPRDPRMIDLEAERRAGKVVWENEGASFIDIGKDVLCLEFHTKMNAIDEDIINAFANAPELLKEKGFRGLVVANQSDHFSVGANIMMIIMLAASGQFDKVEEASRRMQDGLMGLKYMPYPFVAAPHNMALGGGCETVLHADKVVAHAELYMGLVEVGVGLIPGAGGNKELLHRMSTHTKGRGPFPMVQDAFVPIGTAQVSTSAKEAKASGFLRPHDEIVMNRDFVTWRAREAVVELSEAGYQPPEPFELVLPGAGGKAAIEMALDDFAAKGLATPHDVVISGYLANVLTGGDTHPFLPVTEQRLLDLERENFVELSKLKDTQDRIRHMLMHNKPLRN